MNKFCTACGGAVVVADHRFCTACGAAIVAPPPEAATSAAIPPAVGAVSSGLGRRRVIVVAALVGVGALTAIVLLLGAPGPPPSGRTAAPAPPVTAAPPAPVATAPPLPRTQPQAAPPPAPPPPTATPPAGAAITAARWQRYTNTRYGVTIDYPADLFAAAPPPPDNAGRGFEAKAIKARFSVYSHANAFHASRDELMAEDVLAIGDDKPQQIVRDDGYALIGAKDADMIVRRVLLSEGGALVHRLEIVYPLTVAKRFEAIMGRMIGSFAADPGIPEKAAADAERVTTPAPPPAPASSTPSPPRQRAVTLPPPAAPAVQAIDTIRLGLKAPGTRGSAGVALQIPANWTRVAVPAKFLLEYGAPAAGDGRLRLVIEAIRIVGSFSLVREAEAIKSVIKPGVENYREQDEASVIVAGRPARRLTLTFVAMDDPAPQRQDYLIVRAGDTLFKIVVDGPERDAAAIRSVFERVLDSLAVAE